MVVTFSENGTDHRIDLSRPLDISIPLRSGKKNVNAFYIPDVYIEPFRIGSFVGAVNKGGSCNVNNISFNPHGNGTHTECAGHISKEFISLNKNLKQFFFTARLVSITPAKKGGDSVITKALVQRSYSRKNKLKTTQGLIIRTLPNGKTKLSRNYSGTNPAYLDAEACGWLRETGIEHLLLDLPSVDKEMDGGRLAAHHAFWNYPAQTRLNATITELIYVPDKIKDGDYLLNLMIASFENDASPSKPVLYALK